MSAARWNGENERGTEWNYYFDHGNDRVAGVGDIVDNLSNDICTLLLYHALIS